MVSITSFLPLQFSVSVRLYVQFSGPYKNIGKTKVLYGCSLHVVICECSGVSKDAQNPKSSGSEAFSSKRMNYD